MIFQDHFFGGGGGWEGVMFSDNDIFCGVMGLWFKHHLPYNLSKVFVLEDLF